MLSRMHSLSVMCNNSTDRLVKDAQTPVKRGRMRGTEDNSKIIFPISQNFSTRRF